MLAVLDHLAWRPAGHAAAPCANTPPSTGFSVCVFVGCFRSPIAMPSAQSRRTYAITLAHITAGSQAPVRGSWSDEPAEHGGVTHECRHLVHGPATMKSHPPKVSRALFTPRPWAVKPPCRPAMVLHWRTSTRLLPGPRTPSRWVRRGVFGEQEIVGLTEVGRRAIAERRTI